MTRVYTGSERERPGGEQVVAIFGVVVLPKSEYDQFGAANITPAKILDGWGVACLEMTPRILVGESSDIKNKLMSRVADAWERMEEREE